jgi:enamine deaminase RidA (YjgF/YER057c/UK114 family)
VKLTGFVNCAPDFTDMPKVVNGCSDFLVEALGDRGAHARSAVGVASLPLGVAVEVEAIIEIA